MFNILHRTCFQLYHCVSGSQQALTTDRGGATLLFNIPNPEDGVTKAGQDIDEEVCRDLSIHLVTT